jgi:succinoglycan biosynthesis transport protein ExoP
MTDGLQTKSLSLAFAEIASQLLLSSADHPKPCFVVTSAQSGEGVSTTALGIARALGARLGEGLLIDANLRHPTLSEALGPVRGPGLLQVIEDDLAPIQAVGLDHGLGDFALLPAGGTLPDPVGLLSRSRVADVLGQMAKEYGFVVVDTPSLDEGVDALCLAPHTDGVILAVRADQTGKRLLLRTQDRIHEAGARLRGTVLTQRKEWVPRLFRSWL